MTLASFLDAHSEIVVVKITRAQGSTPREQGALMFVSATALHGTIGGGQLEFMAIDTARAMLRKGDDTAQMDVPLGPEIGQCCGGRVQLSLTLIDNTTRAKAIAHEAQAQNAQPIVQIHGAGHIGRALAQQFSLLPVSACLIDSRPDELALATPEIPHICAAIPEAELRSAPTGSAFIILTHDHALDFLLASEALTRADAAYVGMIGSATKRARFAKFHAETPIDALHCPMGAAGLGDKRPSVIAAFIVAEVMSAFAKLPSAQLLSKQTTQ